MQWSGIDRMMQTSAMACLSPGTPRIPKSSDPNSLGTVHRNAPAKRLSPSCPQHEEAKKQKVVNDPVISLEVARAESPQLQTQRMEQV